MVKKLILKLSLLILFGRGSPLTQAFTLNDTVLKGFDLSGEVTIFDSQSHGQQALLMKGSVPYDESKDPTLRRGTENWEEPQNSFFIVPAVIVAGIALALFFNRK